MKKIFLLLFFAFSAIMVYGQENPQNYRIIYLKDGSVVKGYLLKEDTPTDGVRIKMFNGKELYFSSRHIKRIKKPKSGLKYIGEGRSIKPRGRYWSLHLNSLTGIAASRWDDNRDKRWGAGVHFVLGYKYSEHFALGVGAGLDTYSDNFLIPFFADVRGVVRYRKSHPSPVDFTYNMALGYSIHSGIASDNNDFSHWRGGVMLYPAVGIRVARIKQTNILLDVGYKFQYSEHEFQWGWWGTTNIDRIWYKSFVLRLGWEF